MSAQLLPNIQDHASASKRLMPRHHREIRLTRGLPRDSGFLDSYAMPERGGLLWMTRLSLLVTYLYKPWDTKHIQRWVDNPSTMPASLTTTLDPSRHPNPTDRHGGKSRAPLRDDEPEAYS